MKRVGARPVGGEVRVHFVGCDFGCEVTARTRGVGVGCCGFGFVGVA